MERKTKAAAETGVYLVIVAVILVVANALSFANMRARFDMTRNERFTLSQGSGRLLSTLKSPIEIDAYVTKGLPKLDAFIRNLTDLLKLYERAGGGKFTYKIIEAKTDDERSAAKEAGLQEMAIGEGSETGEDKASIAQGYMGLVFKYGSEKDKIPALDPGRSDGLEFWVTNKIREIRDKADDIKHKIGVLTGKDEIKLADPNLIPGGGRGAPNIKDIIDKNFPFYKFEDVDLKDGATEIDKDLDGLIVTQVSKDFTDKELRRIDQFLMRGGKSLLVFASAVNMKQGDGTMKAALSTHNLDKLLSGYGVEMKKDAVFDWEAGVRLPVITQTGSAQWIRAPGIVQAQRVPGADEGKQILDDGFTAFFRAQEVAFPFPSTLVPHADKQPTAKVRVVARTSESAWSESGENVDERIATNWRPKDDLDQKAIAIAVEGKLKAALGTGDEINVPAESAADSRVLVISSSQFLTNPFARAGAGQDLGGQFAMMGPVGGDEQLQMIARPYAQSHLTNTIIVFKNSLDWLSGDSDLVAASAKILGDPNLTYANIRRPKFSKNDSEEAIKKKDEEYRDARKNTQSSVQWTLILVCPLVFAGIGILRWRRRESMRAGFTLS